MRAALLVVAGLALIGFVAISFILPGMAGADAKEAAQALVAGAETAKAQIGGVVAKTGNVAGSGNGVKLGSKSDPKHGELKWLVEANGAIRGWNEKNAIEIAITPALQGGKVSWTCRGYPKAAMPASCGGSS
jgi:hypothetical protein